MASRDSFKSFDDDPAMTGTKYTVRNPHPGWNADDPANPFDANIKNEYGHTHYPKYVDHPTKKAVDYTTTYLGKDQSRQNIIIYDGKEGRPDIAEKVLVSNKDEEDALMAGKEIKPQKPSAKGWSK